MTGLDRVTCAVNHREGDRCPIYCWVFGQPGVSDEINERFGSFEAFADHLDLDMIQAFPAGGPCHSGYFPKDKVQQDPTFGAVLEVEDALEVPFGEVHAESIYAPIRHAVEVDKGQKGRAVWVQKIGRAHF